MYDNAYLCTSAQPPNNPQRAPIVFCNCQRLPWAAKYFMLLYAFIDSIKTSNCGVTRIYIFILIMIHKLLFVDLKLFGD